MIFESPRMCMSLMLLLIAKTLRLTSALNSASLLVANGIVSAKAAISLPSLSKITEPAPPLRLAMSAEPRRSPKRVYLCSIEIC